MSDSGQEHVVGVLAPFEAGFGIHLEQAGYAGSSRTSHLRLMGDLSQWLGKRGSDELEWSEATLEGFVHERRSAGSRSGRSIRSLAPLVEYLQQIGVVSLVGPAQSGAPIEVLLAEYRRYLTTERGLAATTVQQEIHLVAPFLDGRASEDVLALDSIGAGEITAFMLDCAKCSPPATVQRTGTALRSLLRFLHLRGYLEYSLVGAVPATANWKLAALPQYLRSDQVAKMVASCDANTVVGRRDAAVLLLLARLGLRAGEVASLRMDDINWRLGELTVLGKGNRRERLPLPADVGEAIVAYLRGRGPRRSMARELFIGVRAPYRSLTRGAVTQVVARAGQRCGLGAVHAHRLRHTAATAMLHAGASLDEIGQVLRHRHALTTAIYAKVDHDGLRALARPWPGATA